MTRYSKESLETLRQRVDLVDVIASYVPLQRSGASYKCLCPFHEEKTASFMIQRGDSHYHCFGCGAHGDAIAFLMSHAKMRFTEALEFLSEKFQVILEEVEEEEKGPNKKRLRAALQKATEFYHFLLMQSSEGKLALEYLAQRGISTEFLIKFQIGYAPKQGFMLSSFLKEEKFSRQEMEEAGLIRSSGKDFFIERITFPIQDRMGSVIGFSARKFQEQSFGGKYINTPETVLFKKSKILFGFCYSRFRIARERKALIVEGQIDALRLIFHGFDYTVASQGTAFTLGHVEELTSLGVSRIYLAFDSDKAGSDAAIKTGDLFLKKGVEVTVVKMPPNTDPDQFLKQKGVDAWNKLLMQSLDYLAFVYEKSIEGKDLTSPAVKNEIVSTLADQIRSWNHPVLVHESLKKLADLAQIPQGMLLAGTMLPAPFRRTSSKISVDADLIMEMDLLRWLVLCHDEKWIDVIEKNIRSEHFFHPVCEKFFHSFFSLEKNQRTDWISFAVHSEDELQLLTELLNKKINLQKKEEGVVAAIKQLLNRFWMQQTKELHAKVLSATEEEEILLVKEFNELKKTPPQLIFS